MTIEKKECKDICLSFHMIFSRLSTFFYCALSTAPSQNAYHDYRPHLSLHSPHEPAFSICQHLFRVFEDNLESCWSLISYAPHGPIILCHVLQCNTLNFLLNCPEYIATWPMVQCHVYWIVIHLHDFVHIAMFHTCFASLSPIHHVKLKVELGIATYPFG